MKLQFIKKYNGRVCEGTIHFKITLKKKRKRERVNVIHIKMKIKKKRKKSRTQRKSNINKRKRNLQKIELENLLEPLTVNVSN